MKIKIIKNQICNNGKVMNGKLEINKNLQGATQKNV
jgi:hypothetical protein